MSEVRESEEREKSEREKVANRIPKGNGRVTDDGGWTTVTGKRSASRKITSVYVGNLPNGCPSNALWKSFDYIKTLIDAYVLMKRDSRGKTFGFLRFGKGTRLEETLNIIRELRVDGCKVVANIAKYKKEDRNANLYNNRVSTGSRTRMGEARKPNEGNEGRRWSKNHNYKVPSTWGASNKDMLTGRKGNEKRITTIDMGGSRKVSFEHLQNRAVVDNVKDLVVLNDLPSFLDQAGMGCKNIRYMGGLCVLISFKSEEDTTSFLDRCVVGPGSKE